MRDFTPEQLKARLAQPEPPVLLDVREPWEFQTCRIEGSISIPMGNVVARIEELDPQTPVVAICHHGVRSRQVALYLERAGFTDVGNLLGGVAAWATDVDPNMPKY